MKVLNSIAIAAALAVGVSHIAAQKPPDVPASKILSLEHQWNAAYLRGDISVMNSLLADDFLITVEDGTTFSKAGYLAHYGNSRVHINSSGMSDAQIRVHGNVAVVTGIYHETGTDKGKPYDYDDRFTDVWIKINDKWQVVASHYSFRSSH